MKANLKISLIAQACAICIGSGALAAAALPSAAFDSEPVITHESSQAAASYHQAATLAAAHNLRIAYLGSEQFKSQFNGKAQSWPLEENSSSQIVIVESGDQNKDLIMRLLAKGNFVLSVGNAPVDAAKSAFAMLQDIDNQGKLTQSDAEYDANQRSARAVASDDVNEVADSVNGYFYSPNGSREFSSGNENNLTALTQAFNWVDNVVALGRVSSKDVSAAASSWKTQLTRDGTVDCKNGSDVVGTLNVRTTYKKRSSDGDSTYDYWYVRFLAEMDPKTFRNADITIAGGPGSTTSLRSYGPKTTSGESTVSVGLSSGGFDANWSYAIKDIKVTYDGSYATEQAEWTHDIDQTKAVGT